MAEVTSRPGSRGQHPVLLHSENVLACIFKRTASSKGMREKYQTVSELCTLQDPADEYI